MIKLKKLIQQSNKVYNALKKYYDNYSVLNVYYKEFSIYDTHLNSYTKKYSNILIYIEKDESSTVYLFNFYKLICYLFDDINKILSLIDKSYMHPINVKINKSYTFLIELQDQLNKVKLIYKRFNKEWISNKILFISTLTKAIVKEAAYLTNGEKHKKALMYQKLFRKDTITIHLYSSIMQGLLDVSYNSRSLLLNILKILEDDKKFYLIEKRQPTTKNNVHLINPLIDNFSLIPVTDKMKLEDLLSMILPNQTNGKIDMKEYANKKYIGFIILKRIIYQPVDYSIRKLLKTDKKNKSKLFGINENIIKRYANINPLGTHKWDFSCKIIGDVDKMNEYYILETLNGKHYKALAPWFISNKYSVPKNKIENFITYISRKKNKPSMTYEYQNLKIQQAIPNMFLERTVDMEQIKEKSTHIDSHQIQNDLYINIISLIKSIIKNNYNNGKKINDNFDVNNIIHDTKIKKKFFRIVLSNYAIGSSLTNAKEFSAGVFPFSELLITYLKELKYISLRFVKELHNGYNRSLLKPNIFQLPNDKKMDVIITKIEKIVRNAIILTIDHKNNIYTDMTYKYYLLNYT